MIAEVRTGVVHDFAGSLFPRTVSSRAGGLRSIGEIMPEVLAGYANPIERETRGYVVSPTHNNIMQLQASRGDCETSGQR